MNTRHRRESRADNMYPTRTAGYVSSWDGDQLKLSSQPHKIGTCLNPSAALVWLLCDGNRQLAELIACLSTQFGASDPTLVADIRQLLVDLTAQGLIIVTDQPQPLRPFIKIAFAGFGAVYPRSDNFFTWMLSHQFDVLVVDVEHEPPDVLFYREPSRDPFDQAHRIDRAQTFKILVKADDAVSDLSRCDFTFTPVDLAYATRDSYCRLPDWVYYLDWAAYRAAAGGLSEQPLPASYTPQAVCARLYAALVVATEADVPEERSYPAPNTPAPRPVASSLPVTPSLLKLTIGMATYDDFDGVYFTIQAIRLSHPEILAETEFLILDNHPEGTCATPLQQFAQSIPRCRYVTHRDARGTASRDFIFRAAEADYVLCVDSHVLLAPGSLRQFIDFLEQRPDCLDLLQGPLIYDDLCNASTHFEPVWSAGMYGVWGSDGRGLDPTHDPFEIPMQGLGIFGCRKTAWLGFNPRFSGFGGEEGYIHEKFRQQGRKTLCLPFLRWVHRFHRPFGTRYQNTWEDRIRNYYIGFQELGLDTTPIDKHFQVLLGDEAYGRIKGTLDAELASPWFYFDAIYCISHDTHRERWETMQQAFKPLGIAHRIRRFSAVETSESPHLDRALAHRAIIKNAAQCGLKNVLVFEEDAIVLPYTLHALTKAIEELKTLPWTLFQCGVLKGGESFPKAAGCQYLLNPDEAFTESSAIAYHHSLYAKILGDLPDDILDLTQWLCLHDGIDHYLSTVGGRYLTTPSVSSPSS